MVVEKEQRNRYRTRGNILYELLGRERRRKSLGFLHKKVKDTRKGGQRKAIRSEWVQRVEIKLLHEGSTSDTGRVTVCPSSPLATGLTVQKQEGGGFGEEQGNGWV